MITEKLADKTINVFLLMLDDWINSVDMDIVYDHFLTLYDLFLDILAYIFYFLPVSYLVPLICLVFLVLGLRIGISLFRFCAAVLDGIPIIGNFI